VIKDFLSKVLISDPVISKYDCGILTDAAGNVIGVLAKLFEMN
jgi:hypothetical protein